MNPVNQKHQTSCHAQQIKLCHNMASILSTLNLRLYAIKQQQILNADESDVFDQCFERLTALLEQWKTLE